MHEDTPKPRARDLGLIVGKHPPGQWNAITDVAGVQVGHHTVWRGHLGRDEPVVRTGVTAIMPPGDLAQERLYAGLSVFNGFGEMTGRSVIEEWGLLSSPIMLTGTVSVGRVYDATTAWILRQQPDDAEIDVPIPVVAECDDGYLNDSRAMPITNEDVFAALADVKSGPVREGAVGSGTGMMQFQFKGGIGTSSRVVRIDDESFTVGVLLMTNYGRRDQLLILGTPVGRLIPDLMPPPDRDGSCIGIVATDAPLHPRQLQRLARHVDVGLARTGSAGNDGSEEIFMAFSTANRIPRRTPRARHPVELLVAGGSISTLFEAVAEATEEAALNAMFAAVTVEGRDGHVLHALPVERTLQILQDWRPI